MRHHSLILLTGMFVGALLAGTAPARAQFVQIIPANPTSADSVALVAFGVTAWWPIQGNCDFSSGAYCWPIDGFTTGMFVSNWAGCGGGGACDCYAQPLPGYGEIGRCELGRLPPGDYVVEVSYETLPYQVTYSETLAFHVAGDVTGVDGETALLPHRPVLQAHPNPSSGAVMFAGRRISGGEAAGSLRVFDAGGRVVAEKAIAGSGERFNERWDGRDAAGMRLPSGVYQARVEIGREVWTTRFTLIH